MVLIDKENGKSLVEVKDGSEDKQPYASKGIAGTALGLGIAGTFLGLFKGNNGLFGNGMFGGGGNGASVSPNVAVASAKIGGSDVAYPAYGMFNEQYLERKECDDVISLTNAMWQQAYNAQGNRCADRSIINKEMFDLYAGMRNGFDVINAKHNQDSFDLYKYSRDSKDDLSGQIGELKTQVAVMASNRPYQDALMQCDIRRVAEHADFNLWHRTCKMISGEVVLPSTPVVTGFGSYNNNGCCCNNNTHTTSVA